MNFKILFKNPITIWMLWYLLSRIILLKNRKKKLRIGYLANISNTQFGRYNTFYYKTSIGNSQFGDFVYVGPGTNISNAKIGKYCSIGPDVQIGFGIHPTNLISTFPAFYSMQRQCQITFVKKNVIDEWGEVIIGNDVWIGARAIILDNVKIGDGALIAAGAVVTKNVAPYSVVGGVPAKHIKNRFNDNQIEKLLRLKWWNKDKQWIKDNAPLFNSPIDFFLKY